MARTCKFVNQSSSFPELFLDLTTTEPEPELFSFCIFGGAGARAGKARQARLVLEPEPGSLDISEVYVVFKSRLCHGNHTEMTGSITN